MMGSASTPLGPTAVIRRARPTPSFQTLSPTSPSSPSYPKHEHVGSIQAHPNRLAELEGATSLFRHAVLRMPARMVGGSGIFYAAHIGQKQSYRYRNIHNQKMGTKILFAGLFEFRSCERVMPNFHVLKYTIMLVVLSLQITCNPMS